MKCFKTTNPRFRRWKKVNTLCGRRLRKKVYDKIYNDLIENGKEIKFFEM